LLILLVLNQFAKHWLLSNALNSTITILSKAKDEMHLRPSFESFVDDDIGLSLELATLVSNIKSKVGKCKIKWFTFYVTRQILQGHCD
jgi:hypothetical protein